MAGCLSIHALMKSQYDLMDPCIGGFMNFGIDELMDLLLAGWLACSLGQLFTRTPACLFGLSVWA